VLLYYLNFVKKEKKNVWGWWTKGSVCGQEKAAAIGSANNLYRQQA